MGFVFFNFYFFPPNGCNVIEFKKRALCRIKLESMLSSYIQLFFFLAPDSLLEDVCGYSLEGKLEQIFGVESLAFQYKFCF